MIICKVGYFGRIWRRKPQFGLRTLLLSITLAAAVMGWVANEQSQAQFEQQLFSTIARPGISKMGGVFDSWQLDKHYKPQGWWRDLARRVLGDRVVTLTTSPEDFAPLARLTNMQVLYLQGSTASDVAPLAGLTSLRWLFLSRTPIDDLTPLSGLTNLEQLQFSLTNVSDLTPVKPLTKLKQLKLEDTAVRDLAPVAGLIDLEVIDMRSTRVQDISPLFGLRKLKIADLRGTDVPSEQALALQQAMPRCEVRHGPLR